MRKFCVKCGTARNGTARFCTTCGSLYEDSAPPTPIEPVAPPSSAPESHGSPANTGVEHSIAVPVVDDTVDDDDVWQDRIQTPRFGEGTPLGGSRTPVLAGGLAVLLITALGGAGYWNGWIGNRKESVATTLETKLASAGFPDIRVSLSADWVATANGSVQGKAQHDRVLEILSTNSDVKSVTDNLTVIPVASEQAATMRESLLHAGLGFLSLEPTERGTVMLSGELADSSQATTLQNVMRSWDPSIAVENSTSHSMLWTASDIRAALASQGYGGIEVEPMTGGWVRLSGTVRDRQQIAAAGTIAARAGASGVRNDVQLQPDQYVEQTSRPAIPAPVPAPTMPQRTPSRPSIIGGQWHGMVHNGLLDYGVIMEFQSGGNVGSIVGQSIYGTISNGRFSAQCRFNLVLTTDSGAQFTVEESGGGIMLICPGNKRIVLSRSGSQLSGQWFRKNNGTLAFTGTLSR